MRLLLIGVVAFAAAFYFAPALAQAVCGPRDGIVTRLLETYQETRLAMGLAANGNLVEIFVAESGSWTVLITRPDGPTCVAGVGVDWTLDAISVPMPRGQGT